MQRRRFIRLLSGGAVVALDFGLAGCYSPGHYPRRPNYGYYYYPGVNVYFHIYTGYYFYRVDGAWRRARSLPSHIYLSRRDRRQIYIREPRPYDRNLEHHREYNRPGDRDSRRIRPTPLEPRAKDRERGAEERVRRWDREERENIRRESRRMQQ
jgi:hypothetical protein